MLTLMMVWALLPSAWIGTYRCDGTAVNGGTYQLQLEITHPEGADPRVTLWEWHHGDQILISRGIGLELTTGHVAVSFAMPQGIGVAVYQRIEKNLVGEYTGGPMIYRESCVPGSLRPTKKA